MIKKPLHYLAYLSICFSFFACAKKEPEVVIEESAQTDPTASPIVINHPTKSIYPGDTYQLTYSVASPLTDLKWQSLDTTTATVSKDGLVKTKLPGSVLITLSSESANYEATIALKIIHVKLRGIAWDNPADSLIVAVLNEPKKLKIKFIPENAFDKWLSWRSSNEERTVIDKNGILTAKGFGYSFIEVSQGGTDIYLSAQILPGIRELGIPVSFFYSNSTVDGNKKYWLDFSAGTFDLPILITKLELYTYIADSGIPISLKKEEDMNVSITPHTGRRLWRLELKENEYNTYVRGSIVRVYYTVNNEKNEVFDVLW